MKKIFHIVILAALLPAIISCGGTSAKEDPTPSPTPASEEKPAVPTGAALKGEAGTDCLEFSWNAVSGATSYKYRLLKGMTQIETDECTATSHSFTGLDEETAYKFCVKAVNAAGESSWSDYVEATTAKSAEPTPTPGPGPEPPTDLYEQMLIPEAEEDGVARAFPGAEGGGMYVTGGRGGKVIHVTNLKDSGEGSLRAAIQEKGARTIVFDVAGIIELKSALKISNGDLTIAGQTAPGDGICIKNYTTQISAGNVIVRFIRFRLGDEGENAGDSDDATWCRYQNGIILDHCSMSWSIDECASYYANANMTMQWCILAESMKNCSKHSKGSHGYGGIWGGDDASFHHNILAHHDSRNPRFDHPHVYENHSAPARRGTVDFRNNVVYNWGSNNAYGGEGYGNGKGDGINMVANIYKPGPNSSDKKYFMDSYSVYSSCSSCGKDLDEGYPLLYMEGNVHTKYEDISSVNTDGIYWHNKEGHPNYGTWLTAPLSVKGPAGQTCYTTQHTALQAMEQACEWAGASLSRDKVDTRVCNHVRNGEGAIINDMAQANEKYGYKWPDYKATESQISIAATDSDADGIPDYYEDLFGLNRNDATDAAAVSIDKNGRYTNLEMYLHYLVKDIVAAQTEGGTYTALN